MKKVLLSGLVMVILLAGAVRAQDICSDPVDTANGLLKGLSDKATATCRFTGIPFAAPPTGDLRWKPPAPAASWDGVRDADEWGPRCMQKGEMELVNADPSGKMSEDCLYLNIWRPKKSGGFPVMVWIHGGGLKGGTGNTPGYWGDRMAEAGDVVIVTINYRLNVFGFMASEALTNEDPHGSSGNYGVLDQIAALKWVQENIAGFGGDPANVTIFGESAGGWSVCALLATPLAKGLFHRAIIESGGCQTVHPLEADYPAADDIARAVGCDPSDLSCLRNVSAKKILKKGVGGITGGFSQVAHVDGYVFSDTPLNTIKSGDYNNVPLIAGYNNDEIKPLLLLFPDLRKAKPDEYERNMAGFIGAQPDEVAEVTDMYPLSNFNNSPAEAFAAIGRDMVLACPTWSGMAASSLHQPNTFLYRFDYDQMMLGKTIGAMHAMEMPFIFDALDRAPTNLLYNKKRIEAARGLVTAMQSAWLNFAKTGNPNGPGVPDWPAFDPANPQAMIFNITSSAQRLDVKQRCDYWENYNNTERPFWETMGRPEE